MINKVILMGRLVAEPENKTTESGISVTRFRIAVDRRYQKQGEDKKTDFFPCFAFRQNADFVNKHFRKGSLILVCGELNSNTVEKDGDKKTFYEVVVDEVSFTGEKKADAVVEDIAEDDELPF